MAFVTMSMMQLKMSIKLRIKLSRRLSQHETSRLFEFGIYALP